MVNVAYQNPHINLNEWVAGGIFLSDTTIHRNVIATGVNEMDENLSKALKKRDKLREELTRVEQYIQLHKELFGDDEGVSSPQSTGTEPEQPRRRRGKPAEIADAAEKVIREAGRPLQRGELVDRIEETGIEIHSDDKPRYIGTVLWRQQERFVNVEGRGYWLTGVPMEDDGRQMTVFD